MLNHVVLDEDVDVPPLDSLPGAHIARAKVATQHEDPLLIDTVDSFDRTQAREAFSLLSEELMTGIPSQKAQEAVMAITRGSALAHLDALLTAYDWDFVGRAREIRNYVVGKFMEISHTGSEKAQLKALDALGKVTEIGLFTHKVEITTQNMDDTTLEAVLREKLSKYTATEVSYTETPHETLLDAGFDK
jgi:hypothetical protein